MEDLHHEGTQGGLAGLYANPHNPQSNFQCMECGKIFANRNSLTNHLPSHQGRTTCVICGKEFSSPSNLNKHIKSKHPVYQTIL